MIPSILIIAIASLIAQAQHYKHSKVQASDSGKSDLDDLRAKVEALRVAQGFKR
jgi:hypothetical protein